MTKTPAFRATVLAFLVLPICVFIQRALLERAGVELSTGEFVVRVALPTAAATLGAATAYSFVLARHGIALREAMHKLVAGDLSLGAPETANDVARDLLGIRDAFDTMRTELDRALRRMAHADAQRRRLFADLAHELATPASALLALGDTLADPTLAGDEARRARLLRALEAETLRVARLVEDIRDLAELDDPDVSIVREREDVAKIASAAAERIGATPGAAIVVRTEPVPADVDAIRIDQVLYNLVGNARRHTPADRRIFVTVERRGSRVAIVVEDEGPGVGAEALARLGERLFRVDPGRDRSRGGHGLGLSIVRAIAARHDGTVEFEIAASGGLRVTLSLPSAG